MKENFIFTEISYWGLIFVFFLFFLLSCDLKTTNSEKIIEKKTEINTNYTADSIMNSINENDNNSKNEWLFEDSIFLRVDSNNTIYLKRYNHDDENYGPSVSIINIKDNNRKTIWVDTLNTIYTDDISLYKKDGYIVVKRIISTISYHQFIIFDFINGYVVKTKEYDCSVIINRLFNQNDSVIIEFKDMDTGVLFQEREFKHININH